jgi:hypothetical protein
MVRFFPQQGLGTLNIQDLALPFIQLVTTFVTGYISDATFSQKRCTGIFPMCWCTLSTFILNIVTAMCRNLTHDSIKPRKMKLSIRQRKHKAENLIWNHSIDSPVLLSRQRKISQSSNYKGRQKGQKGTNFRMDCGCSRKVWFSRSLLFTFTFNITTGLLFNRWSGQSADRHPLASYRRNDKIKRRVLSVRDNRCQ